MRLRQLQQLFGKGLISKEQFDRIEPIVSGSAISVFYELRTVLYLGVMLFAAGAGILIYENIGEIGHLISILFLTALTVACFAYGFRYAQDYSNGPVKPPTPYFDYIVLLGALLFVSVLTYLQFQYALFDEGLGMTTLITASFFFYCAYRFDHIGILSLAVTALASFFSISISPEKWYTGDFLDSGNLHYTAIIFGAVLATAAALFDRRGIKKHFTFTYINFASLLFLSGTLAAMFQDDDFVALFLVLLYAGCAGCIFFANVRKSFLFLLYAVVFGYIGTTYILATTVLEDPFLWFFYLLISCGGFIFFIIRYRNYFKRSA